MKDHGFVFNAPDGRTILVHFDDWGWGEINPGGYETMSLVKVDLVRVAKMNHSRTMLKSLTTASILDNESKEVPIWMLAGEAINGDEYHQGLFLKLAVDALREIV